MKLTHIIRAVKNMLILLAAGRSDANARELITETQYQCISCGAHPHEDRYDNPGSCPKCGMELVQMKNFNIQPEEVCKLIEENPGILLLDVRTKKEYYGNLGHLKDAKLIHISQLESRISEINDYKNKPILVYCTVAQRSTIGSNLLREKGFTKVYNMLGGMKRWIAGQEDKLPCREKLWVKKKKIWKIV